MNHVHKFQIIIPVSIKFWLVLGMPLTAQNGRYSVIDHRFDSMVGQRPKRHKGRVKAVKINRLSLRGNARYDNKTTSKTIQFTLAQFVSREYNKRNV